MTREECIARFGIAPVGYVMERAENYSDSLVAFRIDRGGNTHIEGTRYGDIVVVDTAPPFQRGEMNVLQSKTEKTKFILAKTRKRGYRYLGRITFCWKRMEVLSHA